MITLKKKRPKTKKRKVTPHYLLKYSYMIGDANGNISETSRISEDNPFLERYVTLLNSLKSTKGHWGISLEADKMFGHLNEKQITENDYAFLIRLMFEEYDYYQEDIENKFMVAEEDDKYASEFHGSVRSDTEYSFLVFEGVELMYIDEYGEKHETVIK